MEDIKKIGDRGTNQGSVGDESPKKKKIKPAAKIEEANSSSDAVEISVSPDRKLSGDKNKLYSVLDEINLAVRTTDEITALVEGISGIVTQASRAENLERLAILEKEARELTAEISKIAMVDIQKSESKNLKVMEFEGKLQSSLSDLKKPVGEIESNIFPFESPEHVGANAEKINQTKAEIEALTKNIRLTAVEIKRAMEIGETAVENSEASTAMVRDVNAAVEMAQKTGLHIKSDPARAIAAIGVSKRAPDLIK
jgi:hypothetical protein